MDTTENTPPTLLDKIKSVGEAIVTELSLGLPIISDEKILSREKECRSCEFVEISGGEPYKCGACGCYLYFKIRMEGQKCPKDKWLE